MSEFIQEMDIISMSFVNERFDLAECFNKFDHSNALKVEGSSSMNDYFKFMVEHQKDHKSISSSVVSKYTIGSIIQSFFKR